MTDGKTSMDATLRELKRLAHVGAYFDSESVRQGILAGTERIPLETIEVVVSELTDDRTRQMIQARLGLEGFRGTPARDRNETFAGMVRAGVRYKNLSRTQQDAPLAILAAQLSGAVSPATGTETPAGVVAPIGDYDRWEVLDYQERRILPAETPGPGMSINQRTIKFLDPDLHEYRMAQTVTWHSGHLPSYIMTSPGTVHIENQQAIVQGDEPGYRFDLVFQLPPTPGGEVSFGWVRLYQHEADDLVKGEVGTVELTPNAIVRKATFTLQFPPGASPASTWSFDRVPALYRLDPPQKFRTLLQPNNGEVTATFQEPQRGYSFGIGWTW